MGEPSCKLSVRISAFYQQSVIKLKMCNLLKIRKKKKHNSRIILSHKFNSSADCKFSVLGCHLENCPFLG